MAVPAPLPRPLLPPATMTAAGRSHGCSAQIASCSSPRPPSSSPTRLPFVVLANGAGGTRELVALALSKLPGAVWKVLPVRCALRCLVPTPGLGTRRARRQRQALRRQSSGMASPRRERLDLAMHAPFPATQHLPPLPHPRPPLLDLAAPPSRSSRGPRRGWSCRSCRRRCRRAGHAAAVAPATPPPRRPPRPSFIPRRPTPRRTRNSRPSCLPRIFDAALEFFPLHSCIYSLNIRPLYVQLKTLYGSA